MEETRQIPPGVQHAVQGLCVVRARRVLMTERDPLRLVDDDHAVSAAPPVHKAEHAEASR